MVRPRVLILRAPGTNCDVETAYAFEHAGASHESIHINRLLERPRLVDDFQILCLPGGFSYGDDIAAGRILGNQIRHHLADALQKMKADGKLILGICNGFQILLKSGDLLDTVRDGEPVATLTLNDGGRFEDRWVRLDCAGSKCVFFAGIDTMYLPIAHAEGKFVVRSQALLDEMTAAGQVALRYTSLNGSAGHTSTEQLAFPHNPNGSMANIAGLCDRTGRVCGLMPHPERHIDPTQHPQWTRREPVEVGEGFAVFRNAVRYFS